MKRSHILMIAYTNYSTDARVIKEAETAADMGWDVDFIALRRKGDRKKDIVNNVTIYRVRQNRYRGSLNSRYLLSYAEFFIRTFIKTTILFIFKKYKIIHINNIPDFLVFTAIIPKLFGSKIILDIHDPMPNTFLTKFQGNRKSLAYRILLFLELLSAKFADKIITVHEPLKMEVLVKDGIPEQKITVLPNFADDQLFRLVENYHIEYPIKMVFHGTIAKRFGLKFIIDTLNDLNQKEHIFLKIIGEGDYAGELEREINSMNLQNYIDFDHKFYPVEQLPIILSDFHLGLVSYELSPATEYMLPVKMMELLSMGIPVITVGNKAIKYYFSDDDCFFYDHNNEFSLKKLFENIIHNPAIILQKREKLLKIRNEYIWSNGSVEYKKLISTELNKEYYGKN